jgi:hypothetical protein
MLQPKLLSFFGKKPIQTTSSIRPSFENSNDQKMTQKENDA